MLEKRKLEAVLVYMILKGIFRNNIIYVMLKGYIRDNHNLCDAKKYRLEASINDVMLQW